MKLSYDKKTIQKLYYLFSEYNCINSKEKEIYVDLHLKRFLHTFNLLDDFYFRKILHLGEVDVFTLMLHKYFPNAEIYLSQNRDAAMDNLAELGTTPFEIAYIPNNLNRHKRINFQLNKYNVEKETWPYEDSSFDVVLCMELLEHLIVDPFFLFCEANRVLKIGGVFIVTTPNITRYEGVGLLLSGHPPYSLGQFSNHGEYGRHNREYAPKEISRLGECAGFYTDILNTIDTYPYLIDITPIRKSLSDSNDDSKMRGQTIIYRGIKSSNFISEFPDELYTYKKNYHCAEIYINNIDSSAGCGGKISVDLTITNRGRYTWKNKKNDLTNLGILLLDRDKHLISRDYQRIALHHFVPPNESIRIIDKINTPKEKGIYHYRFDMVHEFICWFSDEFPTYKPIEKKFSII